MKSFILLCVLSAVPVQAFNGYEGLRRGPLVQRQRRVHASRQFAAGGTFRETPTCGLASLKRLKSRLPFWTKSGDPVSKAISGDATTPSKNQRGRLGSAIAAAVDRFRLGQLRRRLLDRFNCATLALALLASANFQPATVYSGGHDTVSCSGGAAPVVGRAAATESWQGRRCVTAAILHQPTDSAVFPPARVPAALEADRMKGGDQGLGGLRPLATVSARSGELATGVKDMFKIYADDASEALKGLRHEVSGARRDVLFLLLATASVVPAFKLSGQSPILGFLAAGCAMGPYGLGLVSDIHTIETLAEFGIIFFLFEMGLELSVKRLVEMRRDVFGLGFAQLFATTLGAALVAPLLVPGLHGNAHIVIGASLALSSSAFVLQILRDKDELNTRHGRAAFGILLFQDLAIVPLLVAIPLLAGGGGTLMTALRQSLIKSTIALTTIALIGRFVLDKVFFLAAKSKSQEAFLALILLTVTGMSFLTEGLGLSNTLGAFLAGVLLSETKYRYQIEADIVPFRGLLLGLFFITVGFSIDLGLLLQAPGRVALMVVSLLAFKAATIAILCKTAFKMSTSQGVQAGLLLAQGGEFAFVAFRLAQSLDILTLYQAKLLLTTTAITMALTPMLAEVGTKLGSRLEQGSGFSHYVGQDTEAEEIKKDPGLVVVCGYGRIGRVICEVLDRQLIRYIVFEINPAKAIEARNRDLPVFFGDVSRPEVLQNFNVGQAKMVVTAISDRHATNQAIITLKRLYPDVPILARAVDEEHRKRLVNTLHVEAMVPVLPEDSLLLNLPFGGAVLKALGGTTDDEISSILEDIRKKAVDTDVEGSKVEFLGEADDGVVDVGSDADAGKDDLRYQTTKSKSMEEAKKPAPQDLGSNAATLEGTKATGKVDTKKMSNEDSAENF